MSLDEPNVCIQDLLWYRVHFLEHSRIKLCHVAGKTFARDGLHVIAVKRVHGACAQKLESTRGDESKDNHVVFT